MFLGKLLEDLDKQSRVLTAALQPQHMDTETTLPQAPRHHQSHSDYRTVNTSCHNQTHVLKTAERNTLTYGSLYHIL